MPGSDHGDDSWCRRWSGCSDQLPSVEREWELHEPRCRGNLGVGWGCGVSFLQVPQITSNISHFKWEIWENHRLKGMPPRGGWLVSGGETPPWSLTTWPWKVVELEDKDAFPIGTIGCNFSAHVLRTFSGLNFLSSVVGIRYFETPDTRKGSAEKGPTPGKNHWIPECEEGVIILGFPFGGIKLDANIWWFWGISFTIVYCLGWVGDIMTPGEWGKHLSNLPCQNFSEEKSKYYSNSAAGMHVWIGKNEWRFFHSLWGDV